MVHGVPGGYGGSTGGVRAEPLPGEPIQDVEIGAGGATWYESQTNVNNQTQQAAAFPIVTPGHQLALIAQAGGAGTGATATTPVAGRNIFDANALQTNTTAPIVTPATNEGETKGAVITAIDALIASQSPEDRKYEWTWQRAQFGTQDGREGVKEEMLAPHSSPKAYAVMEKDAAFVKIVHGLGRYFDRAVKELRGKVLGRSGEWTQFGYPVVYEMMDRLPYDWKKFKIGTDLEAWKAHDENPATNGTYYRPGANPQATIEVPVTLALPASLAKFGLEQKRTPYEFYKKCEELAADESSDITDEMVEFFKDWFQAAGQIEPGKQSCALTQKLTPVLNDEPLFSIWAYKHLKSYVGTGPAVRRQHSTPVQQQQQTGLSVQDVSNLLDRFSQAAGAVAAPAQAARAQKTDSRQLSEYQLAALRGFSGVSTPGQCAHIHATFQTSKSYTDHREELVDQCEKLAAAMGIEIDPLFLTKEVVEDIVAIKGNPTGISATSKSTQARGISNLVVLPEKPEDAEQKLFFEEAMLATEGNRTVKDAKELLKQETRAPPRQYSTLKLNVATYAILLQVLFTKNCPLGIQVWKIYNILRDQEVANNKQFFDAMVCRSISWAIHNESRRFFKRPMLPRDFLRPVITFPPAYLDSIYDDVMQARIVFRRNFPRSWFLASLPPSGIAIDPAQNSPFSMQPVQGGTTPYRPAAQAPLPPPPPPPTVPKPAAFQTYQPVGGAGPGMYCPPVGSGAPGVDGLSHVHQKLRLFLQQFHQKFQGKVTIAEVLKAAGINLSSLPQLQAFIDQRGNNVLCYNHILGICPFGTMCSNASSHGNGADLQLEFVDRLIQCIRSGIEKMMQPDYKPPAKGKRPWNGGGGGSYKRR